MTEAKTAKRTSRRTIDDGAQALADGSIVFQNEKPAATRAYVVHVSLPGISGGDAGGGRDEDARLEEALGLASAIDLEVRGATTVNLQRPQPGLLFGRGKAEEIGREIARLDVEVAIVDAALSPVQQRNLERAWKSKVLDRTGLILEIFGRRARTREGRLQVDLAHLSYQKSRLVRSWTHLERQRGGGGFMGGPGETQMETDRRIIQERIVKIRKELDKVQRRRELHRANRRRVPYPIVALVGYTNAGKSTLFNRLTQADVMAADQLFATLDPTMRRLRLPHGRTVILSDTVGFIADLPTDLVAAFRATLEEVLEADIIVHVRDISHPQSDAQAGDVRSVLTALGIDDLRQEHIIEVWNKIDLLEPEQRENLRHQTNRPARPHATPVSALTGEGIPTFLETVETALAGCADIYALSFDAGEGAAISWAYENGEVLAHETGDDGVVHMTVRVPPEKAGALRQHFHAIAGIRLISERGSAILQSA